LRKHLKNDVKTVTDQSLNKPKKNYGVDGTYRK